MSSSQYHLTEPYPAPSRQYTYVGRGGAGNKAPSRPTTRFTESSISNVCMILSSTPYPPPATRSMAKPSSQKSYTFGRGGVGNRAHPASERAMFSFDEELERARKAENSMAPIYHIGRGGEGNVVYSANSSLRSSSTSSNESERGFRSSLERIRSRLSRQNSNN